MLDRREVLQGLAALTVTPFIPKVDIEKPSNKGNYVEFSYNFSESDISNYLLKTKYTISNEKVIYGVLKMPFVCIPIYNKNPKNHFSLSEVVFLEKKTNITMHRYLEKIDSFKKDKNLFSVLKIECPKLNLFGCSLLDAEYTVDIKNKNLVSVFFHNVY